MRCLLYTSILEVLDKAHNDESVRALLINAEGKVFSAGGDLTEMERAVNDGDTESLFEIVELVAQIDVYKRQVMCCAIIVPILYLLGLGPCRHMDCYGR